MLNNQHAAATMKIAIDFAQKRYCRTGQAEDIAMAGIEYIIRYNKTSTMPSRWYIYRNVIKAGQDAGYKKKAEQHDPIYTAIPTSCNSGISPVECIADIWNPNTEEYLSHYPNPLESLLEGEEIRMLRRSPIISAQLKMVIDGMMVGQNFKEVCQSLGRSAPRVRHSIRVEAGRYFTALNH